MKVGYVYHFEVIPENQVAEVNPLKVEVLLWASLTSYNGVIGLELNDELSDKEPILIVVPEVEIDLGL